MAKQILSIRALDPILDSAKIMINVGKFLNELEEKQDRLYELQDEYIKLQQEVENDKARARKLLDLFEVEYEKEEIKEIKNESYMVVKNSTDARNRFK